MNAIFELLFCPQHGIFRPDNFMAIWSSIQVMIVEARFYLARWLA
jgi:hypothetical protein